MTADPQPVRRDELDRAIEALRACADPAMGALALDVLSQQAGGRAFFAGEKLTATKAEEHGVDREGAETTAGNLVAILERGAQTSLERALVAAFAVSGLEDALGEEAESRQRIFRFVNHADWLEVCTDYSIYALVDPLLDEAHATLVWEEVAQRVVDEAAGRDGERPEVRARNAARLSALASSVGEAARRGLREVVKSSALDEPTRLLASTLAGDGATVLATPHPSVSGRIGRTPRRSWVEIVRWVSGWAIASWLLRALAFLVGVRREAELELVAHGVEVKTRTSVLGRLVREGEETWKLDALEGAGREVRFPALPLIVGALALSVGVLLGGLVLFDGVRSGELVLILFAAGLLVGGAGLDLALDVFLPARQGRVFLEVVARTRRPLRLTRVPVEEADAFLEALRRAASRGR